MSYTQYATAVAGSILTAAFWNQQVRDNGLEIRAGGIATTGQAAGDLLYAVSATQLARIPSGAANSPLLGAPGGAPHWDGTMALAGPLVTNGGAAGYIVASGVIYPGRIDVSGAAQTSWFIAGHASYGLYSNTGLYLAGGFWVAGPSTITGLTNNGPSALNGTVDLATNALYRARLQGYAETWAAADVPGNGYAYCNLTAANHFYATWNQSLTFVMRGVQPNVSMVVIAIIGQGANYGLGWYGTEGIGGGVRWPSQITPTPQFAANRWDFYTLYTHDGGTTWWGFVSGQNM